MPVRAGAQSFNGGNLKALGAAFGQTVRASTYAAMGAALTRAFAGNSRQFTRPAITQLIASVMTAGAGVALMEAYP